MKKFVIIVVVLIAGGAFFVSRYDTATFTDGLSSIFEPSVEESDAIIGDAFKNHTSNLQVRGQGIVKLELPDDNDGARHQRIVIKMASGQTLLLSHNIDIAPRIPELQRNEIIEFYGEYEWNEKGGVVHWTHHDPNDSHTDGWLRYKGQKYQ